jgi:hypothetical protein
MPFAATYPMSNERATSKRSFTFGKKIRSLIGPPL